MLLMTGFKPGALIWQATALPTVPQPLPYHNNVKQALVDGEPTKSYEKIKKIDNKHARLKKKPVIVDCIINKL